MHLIFYDFYLGWTMAYNALVSGVQQSDSDIHILFFFKFFSHLGYYRILSRVPCAI